MHQWRYSNKRKGESTKLDTKQQQEKQDFRGVLKKSGQTREGVQHKVEQVDFRANLRNSETDTKEGVVYETEQKDFRSQLKEAAEKTRVGVKHDSEQLDFRSSLKTATELSE